MKNEYLDFLDRKSQASDEDGFPPVFKPEFLYDFQAALTEWAVRKGRAAIFADCGMGKTPIQLAWAENVSRQTAGRVLILTPLAVSAQTAAEAQKFGIEAARSRDGKLPKARIVITNYEQLHRLDAANFAGCVCDESSILKSFDGALRSQITQFMRKLRYRLLCTATAAPNDYVELGTSAEALGYLGHIDMLNRFFVNDANNSAVGRKYGEVVQWRFKGHAEEPFWRWVCSWARAVRRPSDLGFDNGRFVLPPLTEEVHEVTATTLADGQLFAMPAVGMFEQREERHRTIAERCEAVAALADTSPDDQSLVWCHLNAEGDLLERIVPGAVQVSGSDQDEAKEEKLMAFAAGQIHALVTKPKIGAWGLNFQNCARVIGFPSHSYEQYYQGVRRCWRFGQSRPVVSHLVTTAGGRAVLDNQRRKAIQAERMFERLAANMKQALTVTGARTFTKEEEIPSWL